jgi:hypothetical protein
VLLYVSQGRTDRQIFAVTSGRILPVGMCGGPVVVNRQWDEVQFRPAVVGMSHETLAQPWDASAGPKGGLHTAKENSNTNSSTTGTASPSARGKRSPVPLNISRDANILRVQALRAKHANAAMTAEESYEDENKLVYGEYLCVHVYVCATVCGGSCMRLVFLCTSSCCEFVDGASTVCCCFAPMVPCAQDGVLIPRRSLSYTVYTAFSLRSVFICYTQ